MLPRLVGDQLLEEIVGRLVKAADPERTVVFGSYAREGAQAGSDPDLLVVEDHVPDRRWEMIRLRKAAGRVGFGIDILVVDRDQLETFRG